MRARDPLIDLRLFRDRTFTTSSITLVMVAISVFGAAMQSIRREAVARASTALNILQQTGPSIGTAVLTVLLASALSSRLSARVRVRRTLATRVPLPWISSREQ